MDKKKFKLLIVDDEEDLREILTFNLMGRATKSSPHPMLRRRFACH